METLAQTDFEQFHRLGYLKVARLLDKKFVKKVQGEIWKELEEQFGILEYEKSTWKTPGHSPRKAKHSPTDQILINDRFKAIIGQLLNGFKWVEPKSWGGYNVNFPTSTNQKWSLANKLWHWDYELFREPELGGLLIFSFFSNVVEKGGGTLIVEGSHHAIRNYHKNLTDDKRKLKHGDHRKDFMKSHPYFAKLTAPELAEENNFDWFMKAENIFEGVPLKVIELTGELGDVVFCHPRLVHAPAGINLNDYPRIMRTKFLW